MICTATFWPLNDNAGTVSPLVTRLLHQLHLSAHPQFPAAAQLNHCAHAYHDKAWPGPQFIDQQQLAADEARYYETIIAEDNKIPTREHSWHDLFNAAIWIQFPRTKMLLNQLHVHDIQRHGAHPRTRRRHHLTHFDECGVVLAIPTSQLAQGNEVLQALARHDWQQALVLQRDNWEKVIFARLFGHANYEMLLNPFIGLTGKWLAVEVPDDFGTAAPAQQNRWLDAAMVLRIDQLDGLQASGLLPPLPLLGVPNWHAGQTPAFYANTDYFRPRRPDRPLTGQLPLA